MNEQNPVILSDGFFQIPRSGRVPSFTVIKEPQSPTSHIPDGTVNSFESNAGFSIYYLAGSAGSRLTIAISKGSDRTAIVSGYNNGVPRSKVYSIPEIIQSVLSDLEVKNTPNDPTNGNRIQRDTALSMIANDFYTQEF